LKPWVVKLGGSLENGACLAGLPELLAAAGGGRVVVVPGGGRYADRVRAAQRTFRFPDAVAHRMALLAMEQFADVLVERAPAMVPATEPAAMRDLLAAGRVPVWLPYPLAAFNDSVPCTWDFTSDSLAVWLAAQLDAELVVLVKAAPDPRAAGSVAALARSGIVDAAFPAAAKAYAGAIACLAYREAGMLKTALERGSRLGLPLLA
jgi:aspartokinase-like uncharacterized kinase